VLKLSKQTPELSMRTVFATAWLLGYKFTIPFQSLGTWSRRKRPLVATRCLLLMCIRCKLSPCGGCALSPWILIKLISVWHQLMCGETPRVAVDLWSLYSLTPHLHFLLQLQRFAWTLSNT
jgi:hypothetical protein